MEISIYEKLIRFRDGDNNYLEQILVLFNPLINKYSRLLDGENTKQDLILYLMKIMNNIPIYQREFF